MAKRLVLFSQPSDTVFEKLNKLLFPDFLNEKVFAYMPSDGSDKVINDQFEPIWKNFTKDNGAEFVFVDNSKRGEEAIGEREKVLSANVLMITGGNTFRLLNHLRKSGLDRAVIDFWNKEGVVLAGFSAGAIVLTPSIEIAKTGCADVNELGLSDLKGLNVVDFEVWPHYEASQAQEVKEYKAKYLGDLRLLGDEELLVIDK